jgi:hypothetical protein
LVYLFARASFARRLGRALAAAGDPAAARVTPLAWGMTAALLGTLFANVFYLTMSFYYFYVFVTLLLALPIVFADQLGAVAPRPAISPIPAQTWSQRPTGATRLTTVSARTQSTTMETG